jgi:nicotinamidase-related amidase
VKIPRGLEADRKVALVISECQRAIVDPEIALFPQLGEQVMSRGMLGNIARLADACRLRGIPVIHAIVRLLPDGRGFAKASPLQAMMLRTPLLRADREESAIHPALAPVKTDIVCERRHGLTGFHGTDLDPLLRALGVETVIIAGVSTNIAIVGMAIEAVNRGFSVVIPEDCTAGATAESHRYAIQQTLPVLAAVTTSENVLQAWS